MTHIEEQKRRIQARRGNALLKCLLGLVLFLAVAGSILSFVDIGGSLILSIAQKALKEQLNLDLAASGVSGNPVKGYTLHDFTLAAGGSGKILSAKSLAARINFTALFRGAIRLAEIAVGGVEMDLDQFIADVQKIKLPKGEDSGGSTEIPIDRISLVDSRFTSQWGTVEVSEVGANIQGTALGVDVDGRVNGVPVRGGADLDIASGVLINRSDINFGKGKILATGGIQPVSPTDKTNTLNLHGSVQGLDLKELTALWPSALKAEDYDGTAGLNLEVTGTSETLKLKGTASYQGTKISGYPVERVAAGVSYSGGRVTVSDIQASILNIPINGEIAIATHPGKIPSIMVKLDARDAALDGLDKALHLPELKGLGGRIASFNANIQGPANALNGTVSLSAPRISYQDKGLTNIAAQVKLSKGDTVAVNSKFSFEGAQGFLQGSAASLLTSPKLDLTANLKDLDVKSVAEMIPDSSQYGLDGKVTASLAVRGSLSNPAVSGTISSPRLSGWGQKLDKPSLAFSFANNVLSLQKSSGTLNGMPIHVSGTVGPLTSSTPDVNINATVTVSPAALKAYVPDIDSYALKGNVNAGVKVQGKLPNPSLSLLASSANLQAMNMLTARDIEVTTALGGDLTKLEKIALNAKAKSLTASGLTLTNLAADVSGTAQELKLNSFRAEVGGAPLTASGTVKTAPAVNANISVRGKGLDLAALTKEFPDLKGQLSGKADLTFDLTSDARGNSGKGSITSSAIKAFGLKLSEVKLPLSLTGNTFASMGGTAKVYGGSAKNDLTCDLSRSTFTDQLQASGVDVNALIQDMTGGLGGKITGQGKLNLKLSGSAAKKLSYSGSGQASVGAGGITGFKWLDLATRLYGTKGIQYSSVTAPFTIQTGKLILKAGSIVNATKNNPLYLYAKLPQDGAVNFDSTLNITAEGSLNYQLVNALVGGGKGSFEGLASVLKGGKGLEDSLKQVLGGGWKGAKEAGSEADFRVVSLKITGKASSPSFSNIKVSGSTRKDAGASQKKDEQAAQQKQKPAAPTQPVKKDEVVKKASDKAADKLIDAIIPGSGKQTPAQPQGNKGTQQAQQEQKKDKKEEIRDKLKEDLSRELQKGLGGLFKR
ncbi:MAG: hypothetical protein K5841_02535 [Fretibacterium sp.]|nr:hypothetical protein [Fretibacterium sp.]